MVFLITCATLVELKCLPQSPMLPSSLWISSRSKFAAFFSQRVAPEKFFKKGTKFTTIVILADNALCLFCAICFSGAPYPAPL